MNRPLPARDRSHRSPDPGRPSRLASAVPRTGRLVRRTAAAASQPWFGHLSRTFGARAFVRRRLGVWAKAVTGCGWAGIVARSKKGPPRPEPGGPGRRGDPTSGRWVLLQYGLPQVVGYQQRPRAQRAGGIQKLPQLRYGYGGQFVQGVNEVDVCHGHGSLSRLPFLAVDPVGALALVGFEGLHRDAHLLAEKAGNPA